MDSSQLSDGLTDINVLKPFQQFCYLFEILTKLYALIAFMVSVKEQLR